MNIPTICMPVYFAAVSHIITVATYSGLLFLGITAIGVIDYYVLRQQTIKVEQLFVSGRKGHYWFWGGVNWVAVTVIAIGTATYLKVYDPISLAAPAAFRFFGAGLPVIAGSGFLYYVLSRLITLPSGRGGYGPQPDTSSVTQTNVEVKL